MWLQVAKFCFCGWAVSPHVHTYASPSYPLICGMAFRLLPRLAYGKHHHYEYWGHVFPLDTVGFASYIDVRRVELLCHAAALTLSFWGASIPLSTVAAPAYIPTNRVRGLPFLHILANICYVSFLMMAILTGLRWLWFWFAFPLWTVTLSIFNMTPGSLYTFPPCTWNQLLLQELCYLSVGER